MATPPYIEVTFDPPLSSDSNDDFDSKAFDTIGKLNPWGGEANDLADYVNTKADQALAAAIGGDLPPLTDEALKFLRVKADESGAEFAEVPEPVTQPTADWEAGTSTDEGIVSPAKVAASAEVNSPVKAWVNFDGTGTVSIRESFNVSSITDNGTGDYTVNFDTALVDANYAVSGAGQREDDFQGIVLTLRKGTSPTQTSSSARVVFLDTQGGANDALVASLAIFR